MGNLSADNCLFTKRQKGGWTLDRLMHDHLGIPHMVASMMYTMGRQVNVLHMGENASQAEASALLWDSHNDIWAPASTIFAHYCFHRISFGICGIAKWSKGHQKSAVGIGFVIAGDADWSLTAIAGHSIACSWSFFSSIFGSSIHTRWSLNKHGKLSIQPLLSTHNFSAQIRFAVMAKWLRSTPKGLL